MEIYSSGSIMAICRVISVAEETHVNIRVIVGNQIRDLHGLRPVPPQVSAKVAIFNLFSVSATSETKHWTLDK
jgi:hypothetical protein